MVDYGDMVVGGQYFGVRQARRLLEGLGDAKVFDIIRGYEGRGIIANLVEERGILDTGELAAFLFWLEKALGLRVLGLEVVEDPETGEFLFLGVRIGECGWDEWRALSRSVKRALREEGFEDMARKVVLVCEEALGSLGG